MVKKAFSTSPLPFRGTKRYYVRRFKEVLKNRGGQVCTVVDLFGGSGLLSRVAKDMLPAARVIYNDYDNFRQRLEHIEQTNELLDILRPLVREVPTDKKVPNETRAEILRIFREREQNGLFVDYITLSGSLLFSGNWANSYEVFAKHTLYNRMVATNYNADNYLAGLEIVSKDYRELFAEHKDHENTLFLLDPPYLQTDVNAYSGETYWQLKDYLDVLTLLDGTKYIFFTSGKSQIIDFCHWINKRFPDAKLLDGAEITEQNSRVNEFAAYKDIMIVKL